MSRDESLWRDKRSIAAGATPAERAVAGKAVLDFFRRALAIKTRYLDSMAQDAMKNAAYQNLKAPWTIEEDEKLETSRFVRRVIAA